MEQNLVQQQPYGLLSLLGAKGTGAAPANYANTVQTVVDARSFYELSLLAGRVQDTAAATNVGDTAEITVPAGEIYAVKAAGIIASAFTGAIAFPVRLRLTAIVDPANTPCAPDVIGTVNAANDQISGGEVFAQPFLLPPGGRLVATLGTDLGAVTCTLSLRVLFARILV